MVPPDVVQWSVEGFAERTQVIRGKVSAGNNQPNIRQGAVSQQIVMQGLDKIGYGQDLHKNVSTIYQSKEKEGSMNQTPTFVEAPRCERLADLDADVAICLPDGT
jgi:hypothetical protein